MMLMQPKRVVLIGALVGAALLVVGLIAHLAAGRPPEDDPASALMAAYEDAAAAGLGQAAELDHGTDASARAEVPVLMYHNILPHRSGESAAQRRYSVEPDAFARQMAWLRERGYEPVSLDQLAAHLRSGAPLPAKPVVLTFDDGWESQHRHALPVLDKFGFKAVFFVTTGYLDHRMFMSRAQVRELADRGMTVGAHTRTHPFLTRVSDALLRDEVAGGKSALEEILGRTVDDFAYPFGDLNGRVVAAVKAAGYLVARGTGSGKVQTKDRLFTLKCFEVHDSLDELGRYLGR